MGQQERQVTDNLQVWRGTWENEGLVRQLVDDYVERTQMMSEQQVCHSFILFGSFREVSILRAITCSCSARHQRLRSQYAHSRLLYERCHPILASGLVSSERAEEAVSRHIFLWDTTPSQHMDVFSAFRSMGLHQTRTFNQRLSWTFVSANLSSDSVNTTQVLGLEKNRILQKVSLLKSIHCMDKWCQEQVLLLCDQLCDKLTQHQKSVR